MITGLALSFPVTDFVRPTGCRLSLFDLPPVKHRGQDSPDWLDQGFPDPPGTAYRPNRVDARADDQNVGKGVFCSIAQAFRRPRCSTTTVWSRGKGGHLVL